MQRRTQPDGLPVSEAITPDQWSEREQQIAERAEAVRRGLNTWMSTTAANVRNFIHDCTPIDIYPDQLREAIKSEENEYRHYEQDDRSDAKHSHDEAIIELQTFRPATATGSVTARPTSRRTWSRLSRSSYSSCCSRGGFNALLFKDAQASGLLGGLMIAFAVSGRERLLSA